MEFQFQNQSANNVQCKGKVLVEPESDISFLDSLNWMLFKFEIKIFNCIFSKKVKIISFYLT